MWMDEDEMQARRERIIKVAFRLFCLHGIERTSIAEIAKESNVSPKSVFRYFGNKSQLVEQTRMILWKKIVTCITSQNLEARLKAVNGFEELKIILLGFEELYQNHSDYILFYYDYQSYCIRNHIRLSEEYYQRILSDVQPVFLHALERGEKDGSISVSLPLSNLFWLIWGIMRYYIEKMVIHTRLFAGENPWEVLFPEMMKKVLENLSP